MVVESGIIRRFLTKIKGYKPRPSRAAFVAPEYTASRPQEALHQQKPKSKLTPE